MVTKLNSKQLRAVAPDLVSDAKQSLKRQPLVFILENIYDTYNIGGLFRLADGLAVNKIYLCGDTATPPNNRIHKASCGTYKIVPWEYCPLATDAIAKFRLESQTWIKSLPHPKPNTLKPQVFAIEQSPTSLPYTDILPSFPLALVVGNESFGVSPNCLLACDATAEIPMWGINKSLNVIVSAAIVAYSYVAELK